MAATAHTEVFWPAGSICCSDQPPASNDVESCSAPLRGLTIRYQKRAVLFPRRHGLPTCENCAWGALGGRQPRARFAHLGLRTASPSKLSTAYPIDYQRQLSGAWRSERLREHARGHPQRQGGGEGRLARGRGAPCVEPKRRATTGVAASRRCTSLVDRRGRELGGGSRLSSAEAAAATGGGGRQVTEGFSRAARQAERPTASSPHLVVSSWWRHGTAAPRA